MRHFFKFVMLRKSASVRTLTVYIGLGTVNLALLL